jgi:hypothetical protein
MHNLNITLLLLYHIIYEKLTKFGAYFLCVTCKHIVFSVWEGATRHARNDDTKTDAVGVIAFYRRLLHYDCIILVKQYRPALKAYTIEMPAGELK